jgi:M6 family metalloprotease-like protein
VKPEWRFVMMISLFRNLLKKQKKEELVMFRKSGRAINFILVICMIIFFIFSVIGCTPQPQPEPQPQPQPDPVKPEIEYDKDYPRTPIQFTYNKLHKGTINPEGTIRLLVIPIEIEGGDPIDEEVLNNLKLWIEGPYDNRFCLDTRQYNLNASYGRVNLVCDIMPTYKLGITLDEWTTGERLRKFKYIYSREIIEKTIKSYVPDSSIYDSDSDGYLDGVICVINEPYEIEQAAGAPMMDDYEMSLMADNAKVSMFIDIPVYFFNDPVDHRSNILAHELAHCFGIMDYYDYRMKNRFAGNYDLQSISNYGDWNSYSKMAVGWIDPYVITPDVEKVTLKLRNSAEYPDAILIPCGQWNGTPFDEYLLIDVFGGRGNNEKPFSTYFEADTETDGIADLGGVRLLHVDARLMKRVHTTGKGLGWFDDFSGAKRYTRFDVCHAYSNSTMPDAESMDDSPDKNPNYHLLSLILAGQETFLPGNNFYSSYLFHTGDVFTMEKYQSYFPNYPLSNKKEPVNYRFTVESFDSETLEAIIMIERE